jgi:hypothetical protein
MLMKISPVEIEALVKQEFEAHILGLKNMSSPE